MNQMTTRVKTTQLGQSHLIPALGEFSVPPDRSQSDFPLSAVRL